MKNKYKMILSENHTAEFGYKENANIVLLGSVGTYKTRSHILPNIINQDDISMVIADTKGELEEKTANILKEKGYVVKSIDFNHPEESLNHFNPFSYIRTPEEILEFSKIIVSDLVKSYNQDPYWDDTATLLINAVASYLVFECRPSERTFVNLQKLIFAHLINDDVNFKSPLSIIFEDLEKAKPECFAVKQWKAFKVIGGSVKTLSTIMSVTLSKFSQFLTPAIEELTAYDDINFFDIGKQKTALFVRVSDVDRSKDKLVSIFYTVLLNKLREEADSQPDKGLPIHTHFFLDDFCTNCVIPNFDNYISCLRSREISATLVIQNESQLKKIYDISYNTIISNCIYYLFLGSSDIHACTEISKRMNLPLDKVLYKKQDEIFILKNFNKPIVDKIYDIQSHKDYGKIECENYIHIEK